MYFFYIDESGTPHPHSVPLANGQTPIFSLAALAVHSTRWRDLDRQYLYLKRTFFQAEIGTKRAEYHEVKGNYLVSPRNRGSSRNTEFLKRTLRLCEVIGAKAFAISILKNPDHPHSPRTLYTIALQYLVERLHLFLENSPGDEQGLIIADSRAHDLDREVAQSHLSFLFGNTTGRAYYRMVEAPLFADSKLTAGLQVADIVGGCLYANAVNRRCRDVAGVTDYSSIERFWPFLDNIQFRGPALDPAYPVTYGYRIVNHQAIGPL